MEVQWKDSITLKHEGRNGAVINNSTLRTMNTYGE